MATTTATSTPITLPRAAHHLCVTEKIIISDDDCGFTFNIFIRLCHSCARTFDLLFFFIGRMHRRKIKDEKRNLQYDCVGIDPNIPADVRATANKIAEVEIQLFQRLCECAARCFGKRQTRLKKMPGSLEVIENVRKHIADFKDFIEKRKIIIPPFIFPVFLLL